MRLLHRLKLKAQQLEPDGKATGAACTAMSATQARAARQAACRIRRTICVRRCRATQDAIESRRLSVNSEAAAGDLFRRHSQRKKTFTSDAGADLMKTYRALNA